MIDEATSGKARPLARVGTGTRPTASPASTAALMVAGLLAVVVALTAAIPVAGASEASQPDPLRRADKLRAQDIRARGDVVVLGWRQGGSPDRLFISLSRDGGASFLRGSGKLRTFRVAGLAGRGMSVAICGRRKVRSLWTVSALRSRTDRRGDSDLLLTRRGLARPAREASQLFLTSPRAKRTVRDADVACVGGHHLAIAWIEKKDGRSRARLAIRKLPGSGGSEAVRKVNLGPAVFGGGISVAATPDAIHVVWTKNERRHLRYERFRVKSKKASRFVRGLARGLAWRGIERPRLAARGRKVVVAYSDGGDLALKLSTDRGRNFGSAVRLADGSPQRPSRARSVSLSGTRILVGAIDRSSGQRLAARFESPDLGSTWSELAFEGEDLRLGALEKIDYRTSRRKELSQQDEGRRDVLRVLLERP